MRREKPFPGIIYHIGFCKEDIEKYWETTHNAHFTNKDEKQIYVVTFFF